MGGKSKTAFSLHFKVKFVNMNKVNYQKVLEQIIEKNEDAEHHQESQHVSRQICHAKVLSARKRSAS